MFNMFFPFIFVLFCFVFIGKKINIQYILRKLKNPKTKETIYEINNETMYGNKHLSNIQIYEWMVTWKFFQVFKGCFFMFSCFIVRKII